MSEIDAQLDNRTANKIVKSPVFTESQLEDMIERIANGTSIRQLAKFHGISFTTLRDRINRFNNRDRDKEYRIKMAVLAVLDCGMSYRKASKKYEVSKSTIFDYVQREKTKN